MLAAPGRLSITKGWPNFSESLCASMRPGTSEPPGAKPTMRRTGRVGYAAFVAAWAVAAPHNAAAASASSRRRMPVIPSLLFYSLPLDELRRAVDVGLQPRG